MAVKQQAKPKGPSRLIIYTMVGAVAVYAYVLQTTPDKATHTTRKHTTHRTASATDDGVTDADLNAHFARYATTGNDPFAPAISLHPQSSGSVGGSAGQWTLTGVNTIDGVTTASVENQASNDSVFLKVGDSWNGLKVTSINTDSIALVNGIGQETRLSFPGNDLLDSSGKPLTTSAVASSGGISVPNAPPLPSFGVRPMSVPGPPGGPGGDPNGGGQNN